MSRSTPNGQQVQAQRCEHHGCDFEAVGQIKRGGVMDFLWLCTEHREQFRSMTNAQCEEVDERRQPRRARIRDTNFGVGTSTHASVV